MAKFNGYIAPASYRVTERKANPFGQRDLNVVTMQDVYAMVTVLGKVSEKPADEDSDGSYTLSVAVGSAKQTRRISAFTTEMITTLKDLKPGTVISARGNTLIANQGGPNSLAVTFIKVESEPVVEAKVETQPEATQEEGNQAADIA